jgi:hypothetical protein
MLIVALVLAVIGLAALVTAVVTSNEVVAWVCIAASVLGVILLIVDAIRERQSRASDGAVAAPADEPEESATADVVAYSDEEPADSTYSTFDADYPDESLEQEVAAEDHPEELVSDDPESDTPDDDEPELPEPAEEAALHTVDENEPPVDEVDDLDAEADEPDKR